MKEYESVLYTDGKNVKVTSKELIVDSARYLFKSINNVSLHFVRHYKYPPLTFIIAGVLLIITSFTGVLQNIHLDEVYIFDILITPDRLLVITGSIISLLGLLWLSILHNEYVVILTTDDGLRSPISGRKKDEVSKIVEVLKNAVSTFKKNVL